MTLLSTAARDVPRSAAVCRDGPRSAEMVRGQVLLGHPYGCEID
eukprot:CAMPEP_0185480590 /NCGR_PEP_ID=MMETSP1366-20130426/6388_1 /TAXON_ID=38817 /ORGANISM="Gephyrocapsa oceanica, Strain RCC1303" /LENGTH=43 /DNA_ID= /DNA_START= /DNA_END= /DNA_ORIENTATION=